jgi:hypothetical protein
VERRRLCVHSLQEALRLWKSVVTFSVAENTSCCLGVWRQRMPVSREHRLSLTGSRWDILWLSGRGKTPTFLCTFCSWRGGYGESVMTVAVTRNTTSGHVVLHQRVWMSSEASIVVDRKVDGKYCCSAVAERRRLCVSFPVFSVAVIE